jgi:hypothetical protein
VRKNFYETNETKDFWLLIGCRFTTAKKKNSLRIRNETLKRKLLFATAAAYLHLTTTLRERKGERYSIFVFADC